MGRLVAVLATALLIAPAGCSKRDNADGTETRIKVQSVDCTDSAKAGKGTKFTCTVEGANTSRAARTVIQSVARERIADRAGIRVRSVDCPDSVNLDGVEGEMGTKFTCTVKGADGSQAPITVTQTDVVGWELSASKSIS